MAAVADRLGSLAAESAGRVPDLRLGALVRRLVLVAAILAGGTALAGFTAVVLQTTQALILWMFGIFGLVLSGCLILVGWMVGRASRSDPFDL
jgi:hypothetical protein